MRYHIECFVWRISRAVISVVTQVSYEQSYHMWESGRLLFSSYSIVVQAATHLGTKGEQNFISKPQLSLSWTLSRMKVEAEVSALIWNLRNVKGSQYCPFCFGGKKLRKLRPRAGWQESGFLRLNACSWRYTTDDGGQKSWFVSTVLLPSSSTLWGFPGQLPNWRRNQWGRVRILLLLFTKYTQIPFPSTVNSVLQKPQQGYDCHCTRAWLC